MKKIRLKKLKNRWVILKYFCSNCSGEYMLLFRGFKRAKKYLKDNKCYCDY